MKYVPESHVWYAKRLTEFRKREGLSQFEMSALIGIKYSRYKNIENGWETFPIGFGRKLKKAFPIEFDTYMLSWVLSHRDEYKDFVDKGANAQKERSDRILQIAIKVSAVSSVIVALITLIVLMRQNV